MTEVRKSRPRQGNHWRFVALTVLMVPAAAGAQTLDAPVSVCVDDEFDVAWTGPDGAGDRVTLANPTQAPDQSLAAGNTSDGSPLTMSAPSETGFFEVRYVRAEPEAILVRRAINVSSCASSASSSGDDSGSSSGSGSGSAAGNNSTGPSGPTSGGGGYVIGPDKAVLVTGVQTNYGDVVNREGPYGNFEGTIDALCDNSGTIGWALETMVHTMEQAAYDAGLPVSFDRFEMAFPDAPSRAYIRNALRTVRDEVCDDEEQPPEVQPFVITYAYCRMAMITPGQVMDIHLPPSVGTGTMSVADYSRGEAVQITLQRSFDQAAMVTGPGWSSQVNMTSPSDGGTRIGYPVTQYGFDYSGGLGGGAVPFANMVSTETEGTVFVSNEVPGLDIVRTFYENLTAEVSPDQGGMSFFAGLVNNLVGMLRNGLPLEIDQTISSKIMGRTTVSGRSHSYVTGVELIDMEPSFCGRSLIPPDMPVQDLDQQMSEAMSQSGASQGQMNEAMQQYQEAMQNMTPEQKKMMEQYGMGDMLQNMTGGAAPGAQPGAGGGVPGSDPRALSNSAGSNMPPNDELQGGSLTESVQKHLQALGYDVGNTSGEASLETTIAISTFQAEKGMEVTGEVSPQLLGILSAEIDSRR